MLLLRWCCRSSAWHSHSHSLLLLLLRIHWWRFYARLIRRIISHIGSTRRHIRRWSRRPRSAVLRHRLAHWLSHRLTHHWLSHRLIHLRLLRWRHHLSDTRLRRLRTTRRIHSLLLMMTILRPRLSRSRCCRRCRLTTICSRRGGRRCGCRRRIRRRRRRCRRGRRRGELTQIRLLHALRYVEIILDVYLNVLDRSGRT